MVRPDGNKLDYGELKRDELEARGLKVVIAEEPTVVAGHAFTSGHLARITDLEMSPPAARLEARAPGSACDATFHFPPGSVKMEAKPGDLVKDIFWGEHAAADNVKDRGLVVISSCGHAGIIHAVRQIRKSTGTEKVHAVVGRSHLAPYPDELIAKTVEPMKEINPDYLIPMQHRLPHHNGNPARDAREANHCFPQARASSSAPSPRSRSLFTRSRPSARRSRRLCLFPFRIVHPFRFVC